MEGGTTDELRSWRERGCVLLAGAAPRTAIERLPAELDAAADRLLVVGPGEEHPSLATRRAGEAVGAVDPYVLSEAARELLLAPPVVAVLREALGATPMLLDAVGSAAGAPSDGPYRDPTYVPLSEPESLAGVVVALAETRMPVHPGSHRLPVERFSGRYRHVNVERDGEDALDRHRAELLRTLEEAGLAEAEIVTLRAGDVLVWQADLVHRAVEGDALVAHVAPAAAEPWWFAHRPDRAYRVPHGDACFTSRHYVVSDVPGAVADERPPAPDAPRGGGEPPAASDPEGSRPNLGLVEHELDRHDGLPTPPTPPHRGGGLVDRMRGRRGRRQR